jgi:hypothetical protein
MKNCVRSTKCLLPSILNNIKIHDAVQTWRFDGTWVSQGRQSNLSNSVRASITLENKDGGNSSIAVPLHGKRNYRPKGIVLNREVYSQIDDLWAIESKVYDKMRDRYRRQTRGTSITMQKWIPTGRQLSAGEEKMRQMTPNAQVSLQNVYN